jgi:radical SAM superfamily enzyme YgiQ (UPF0313 family)
VNEGHIDILMVFPSGGTFQLSNFTYNLGSAYVIGFLRSHGLIADQFISNESFNVRECVKNVVKYNPKTVGFTVYETNFMQCTLICDGLKAFNSNIITIFGGPTPTVQSKEILETVKNVDICVRGEGEETLLELLSILSDNNFDFNQTSLVNVKGISFKKKDKVMFNPSRDVLLINNTIKNYLDKYPSPYLSEVIPVNKAFPIGIITARGCNQNCVYCNCTVMSQNNIFTHSTKRVIEELLYFNEFKKFSGPIPLNDDGFTLIPSRAKKICENIIENNIELSLSCITRCDKVNEEILDLMKQAGFVSIGFSLESAVPKVLRAIGKVNPPKSIHLKNYNKEIKFIENLETMTSYAKKIGIKSVYASIMVGLPGETIQDAQKTVELVNKLDIDFYTHNYLRIFKGTPIYQSYKDYGYKIKTLQKNKIFIYNDYPFDIFKIQMSSKSAEIKNSKLIDYRNLKVLSLNPRRSVEKHYFENVIIKSDTIKKSLVKWLQENLAINGTILQIYSSKSSYKKKHEKNFTLLYNEFSPTMYYECYYWELEKNRRVLTSERRMNLGDQIGLPLEFVSTYSALKDYKKENININSSLCIEDTELDTRALYDLLIEISGSENCLDILLDSEPLPFFQCLCRWSSDQANCQKLETVIIDADDSIRVCWNSDALGIIGAEFTEITRKLDDLQKRVVKERNCINCDRKKTCIRCLFTYPLSPKDYCIFKRRNDTNKATHLIFSLDILKDFIFKPITFLDF